MEVCKLQLFVGVLPPAVLPAGYRIKGKPGHAINTGVIHHKYLDWMVNQGQYNIKRGPSIKVHCNAGKSEYEANWRNWLLCPHPAVQKMFTP